MPFKTFVAGEILTASDVNTFLGNQAISVFDDATARDAAIVSPVHGQFAFRTDDDVLEFWDGSAWLDVVPGLSAEYIVIAGGGGGGQGQSGAHVGAGGGAGGYRSNVSSENSGGGQPSELLSLVDGTYPIIVGAGGAPNTNGSNSRFAHVISFGGGRGGGTAGADGASGGSGGGGRAAGTTFGGAGTFAQGFQGGNSGGGQVAGGGGGAGQAGFNGTGTASNGKGGDGVASSITGTSVTRAGGGGGANPGAPGGAGGGGAGADGGGTSGTANTGGGGGGAFTATPGSGGSGVVIFKVPTRAQVSFSAGVTHTVATVGLFDVYTVTATSTTSETVTIG